MGGALTGASCYNLSKLPKEKQDSLLKDYYTKSGLNYNLARVSIGSCDFNKESYSYATENDLKDFSLKQDYNYFVQLVASRSGNRTILFWYRVQNLNPRGAGGHKIDADACYRYHIRFLFCALSRSEKR